MDLLHQLLHWLKPEGITELIRHFGLLGICLVIFAETGFFALLPGDSLLVLCGIFAATPDPATGQAVLPLLPLLLVVPLCGVAGDQVGYWIGSWLGRAIYGWPDFYLLGIPFFKRAYLKKTEDFYARWGTFTIVAGRWVPIVRTFAPIVAGITKMPFRTFVSFNVVGAITWVWSMVLTGYFLPPLLAKLIPGFQPEDLARHIDKVAIVIVALSLLPIAYTLWKEKAEAKARKRGDRRVMPRRGSPERRGSKDRRR